MARNTVGNIDGLANTLGSDGGRAGSASSDTPASVSADYNDVAKLRAALKSYSSTSYTDARLDLMTRNDMIYALRLAKAPSSIN